MVFLNLVWNYIAAKVFISMPLTPFHLSWKLTTPEIVKPPWHPMSVTDWHFHPGVVSRALWLWGTLSSSASFFADVDPWLIYKKQSFLSLPRSSWGLWWSSVIRVLEGDTCCADSTSSPPPPLGSQEGQIFLISLCSEVSQNCLFYVNYMNQNTTWSFGGKKNRWLLGYRKCVL